MSNQFLRNRFLSIIDRYLKGKSSDEENELVDYFYESIEDKDISDSKLSSIKSEIKSRIDKRREEKFEPMPKRNRFIFLKVASCVALLVISSLYIYKSYFSKPTLQVDTIAKSEIGNKMPVIVLSDGKSYTLKDSLHGQLSYKVVDDEKVFVVSENFDSDEEKTLNKIQNPTDKVFAFQLQDGTITWLSPNSTLEILPAPQNKRMVKVEGTVLFNVRKIKTEDNYIPFVVKTALQTIEVLGTKFIVNSPNRLNEDVFLLEGKIRLTHNIYQTKVILKPNQKASLKSEDSKILITKSTQSYKIEAWHRALFHFENENVGEVMGEIGDWYGKTIIVDSAIKNIPITGMISRYKQIDEVLEIIQMTNNIKYIKLGGIIYVR